MAMGQGADARFLWPLMFIRFVTERRNPVDGAREGFLQAAYLVVRDAGTPSVDLALVGSLLDWFADNLEEPDRLNRSRSKKGSDRPLRGISWFKPTAVEHISKAFDLISVLKEQGYQISMLRTERPGFVVYEDKFQVVAEPFADTPT